MVAAEAGGIATGFSEELQAGLVVAAGREIVRPTVDEEKHFGLPERSTGG